MAFLNGQRPKGPGGWHSEPGTSKSITCAGMPFLQPSYFLLATNVGPEGEPAPPSQMSQRTAVMASSMENAESGGGPLYSVVVPNPECAAVVKNVGLQFARLSFKRI